MHSRQMNQFDSLTCNRLTRGHVQRCHLFHPERQSCHFFPSGRRSEEAVMILRAILQPSIRNASSLAPSSSTQRMNALHCSCSSSAFAARSLTWRSCFEHSACRCFRSAPQDDCASCRALATMATLSCAWRNFASDSSCNETAWVGTLCQEHSRKRYTTVIEEEPDNVEGTFGMLKVRCMSSQHARPLHCTHLSIVATSLICFQPNIVKHKLTFLARLWFALHR
jgi:hypothetical protein